MGGVMNFLYNPSYGKYLFLNSRISVSFCANLLFVFLFFYTPHLNAQWQCGDCDHRGDGITIVDALNAAQMTAGLSTPTAIQQCICDVNNSGNVDILDALYIAQTSAGYQPTLNCPTTCPGFSLGDVWLETPTSSIIRGNDIYLNVFLNTFQTAVGAYHFHIYFDEAMFDVDTSYGSNGVLYHPVPQVGYGYQPAQGEFHFNAIFLTPEPSGLFSVGTIKFISSASAFSGGLFGFYVEVETLIDPSISIIGDPTPRFGFPVDVLVQ